MSELIERLNQQAKEIAGAGHNGWGNTMLDASETIEKIAQEAADYCMNLESTIAEQKRTIADMEAREKMLQEFQEGQWWIKELDAIPREHLTDDAYRAVAVVHNLLKTINAIPDKASPESDIDQAMRYK